MQELRFVAVSEDGRYAVLAVPGRSARFVLPIDERLRAVALGQTSRLAQYEIEVESPLRPKEIQARIRAGETVEEIADAAGIAVERVRWFEAPVLAERAYVAGQAQSASVRRHGDSTPGPQLGEVVAERLSAIGADPDGAQWDAKKRGDGSWQVQLTFTSGGDPLVAEWVFDPRRRHVLPADDNAARMSLPGAEPPQPAAPLPGEATVTRLAPRLSTSSGHVAVAGHGQGNRVRSERSAGSGTAPSGTAPSGTAPSGTAPSAPVPSSPTPVVPSVSVPSLSAPPESGPPMPAGPGNEVSRPPAAERNSWSRAAGREPSQASRRAADTARENRPADARPVETSAESPAAPEEAAAQAQPADESAGRPGRKAARGKRSSVPSWDEIMFGSARQRD
jgi:Protein of unknown function (DUF3071)